MPRGERIRGARACSEANASLLEHPDRASLKRLAWAYGCAPRGSAEEAKLEQHLRARVIAEARS